MLRISRKEFDVFLSSCRGKGPISLVHFLNMPRDDLTGFTYYLIRVSFDIFCRSRRENINITHFIRCEGSYTTLVFYYSRSHYWCPDVHIDVIYNFLRKKFDTYDLFLSRVFWSRTIASSKIQKFTVAQRWYIKESMIFYSFFEFHTESLEMKVSQNGGQNRFIGFIRGQNLFFHYHPETTNELILDTHFFTDRLM